jgi:hypothetical protein
LIWSAKRFIVTDTLGLLLTVVVVTVAVQDRDGAKPALLQAYLQNTLSVRNARTTCGRRSRTD